MTDLLIKNARLLDPHSGRDELSDLRLSGELIAEIGNGLSSKGAKILNANGLCCAPGLIDMRVVTGEPGAENKETIASASKAAAAGGVTSLMLMPSTNPVLDDPALLDHVMRRGRETADTRIYVAGALTKGLAGESMSEIGLMAEAGALLFCNGDTPIQDSRLMSRLLSYSAGFNALIAHRPDDAILSAGACAHASDFAARLGLPAASAAAEHIGLGRDLELARDTGARLLVDMVSSSRSLDMLRAAKLEQAAPLAASVSINHLALNELDIGDYRTFAKLNPPLRSESDRQALLAGINDGTIDVIVSAHDPRPAGEKRRPFADAAPGATGLELLLAAGLTLCADGQLDLMAFLRSVTSAPAALLGLPQGKIAKGAPADLALFDLGAPWLCNGASLRSKSKNTPFDGRTMQGRTVMTICAGQIIFDSRP